MKNVIIGICSCVLAGILLLTVYTLHGRSIRRTELNNALTAGIENTLERLRGGGRHAPKSNEELIGIFLQELLTQIDSHSQVTVHILDADYEKGLLSVEAVLSYVHPLGLSGTVASRQTAILESYEVWEEAAYCSVDYIVEGAGYKTYNVQKGSSLMIPGAPQIKGKRFLGWRELKGSSIVSLVGKIVEESCVYVAVFE